MGYSAYSGYKSVSDNQAREALANKRAASHGVRAFTHDLDVRTGRATAVHDKMDPSKIKDSATGKRESRDNDKGNSNAICVLFDVTGSMGRVPRVLQTKLAKLMTSIQTKAVIDDPQILFGAIGDVNSDRAPLQVGQFESDLAMDEDLDKFFLEGNGGGQNKESYDMGLYFLDQYTSIDCHEKRGKKGYAFFIGDEECYQRLVRNQVDRVFGENKMEEDVDLKTLINKVQERYELFFIVPTNTYYNGRNKDFWADLLGERAFFLDDEKLVCETIVTTIGLTEGTINGVADMADDLAMNSQQVDSVTRAIGPYVGASLTTSNVDGQLATNSPAGVDVA